MNTKKVRKTRKSYMLSLVTAGLLSASTAFASPAPDAEVAEIFKSE